MADDLSGASSAGNMDVHDANSNALYKMGKRIKGHFPNVPVTNCTELRRALDDPMQRKLMVVVDVRQLAETEVSMIPGSLTAAEFEARRDALKGKTVVCYCTVGYRSSAYAAKLQEAGVEGKNLEGGIVRWAQKRYPLVARGAGDGQEQEVTRVHVYGKQWALAPEDYEQVQFKHPLLSGLRSILPSWLGGPKKS